MTPKKYDVEVPEFFKQVYQFNHARVLKKDSPNFYEFIYFTFIQLLEYDDNKDYLKKIYGDGYDKLMDSIDSYEQEYKLIGMLSKLCSKKSRKQEDWDDKVYNLLREVCSLPDLIRKDLVKAYSLLVLRTYLRDVSIKSEELSRAGENATFSYEENSEEEKESGDDEEDVS